ncbi:hypothetical protein MVEN_00268300 [Mycena venus]|uniref:TLC domain-containing protein n=1 Tax=Mycena venus TaxID=2733690 RepID=A0A8H6Z2Q0_9AGAR|nr:hypothetical protein MVEN_00268300 [Mycena venus]
MLDFLGVVPAPAPAVDAGLMNLTTTAHGPLSFLPISLATLSKLQSGDSSPIFLPALITLIAAYPALAPLFPSARQRAWVLTTIASALMTASSVPFVADYVWRGGVLGVQGREEISEAVNRFFQAYLTADMLVGFFCYRSQIGFLTGWVHHVVYIGITEVAVRCGWAHIFCLAAVMELPTFLLGASTLLPALRSNALFALTFFATRICFHLALIGSYAMTPGLRTPAAILVTVFPLHAMWFKGCVAGFIRRYHARVAARAAAAEGIVVEAAPSIGIDGSTDGKSGVEKPKAKVSNVDAAKARHPLAADIHADARSLAHHARPPIPIPAAGQWGVATRLHRLRAVSSALLERAGGVGAQRWLSGPAGWVSPGVTRWLSAGEKGGRWGVRKAILDRVRTRRPIRPRATMMARRMSASLIAVLPTMPTREVVLDYVRSLA